MRCQYWFINCNMALPPFPLPIWVAQLLVGFGRLPSGILQWKESGYPRKPAQINQECSPVPYGPGPCLLSFLCEVSPWGCPSSFVSCKAPGDFHTLWNPHIKCLTFFLEIPGIAFKIASVLCPRKFLLLVASCCISESRGFCPDSGAGLRWRIPPQPDGAAPEASWATRSPWHWKLTPSALALPFFSFLHFFKN